jgi:hypothetical protein
MAAVLGVPRAASAAQIREADCLRPHPQRSGEIKDVGFAVCIDTGPAVGGWLTCLDVNSGDYWQANENGLTRGGKL